MKIVIAILFTALVLMQTTVFAQQPVGVSANPLVICNAGDIRPFSTLNGNYIQQCQNNVWVNIQTCNAPPTLSNGQWQCPNPPQDFTGLLLSIGLIILLVAIFGAYKLGKMKGKKRK